MDDYTLNWPPDFDDFAWELESKGWFVGLEVVVGDRILRPTFYDPIRLSQDMDAELRSSGIFTQPVIIVIKRLSRESIEAAIEKLASEGQLGRITGHGDL